MRQKMPLIMGINNNDNRRFFALLALIVILVAAVLLSSCMTNRKGQLTEKGKNFIATHCHGSDSVVTNTDVVFKDTTIFIDRVGETIYLQNPCDSVAPVIKVKNGIKSTVLSIGKTKVFICEADSLKAVIKQLERKSTIRKLERIVIEKPCDKEHITGTKWMWIRLGQILSGFLLFQALIRFLSTYPVLKWLRIIYVFKF